MKASVKLREGKQPLVRAKLPVRLLGVPLLSGISVGSTEELGLHVGTLFDTGPSCRLTYRPNDVASPFSLLIKTGFGLWGSPTDAAMIMAAEFNLSSKGTPWFAVQVKPRLGNFSVRKDAVSPPCILAVPKMDSGSEKHSGKMIAAEVHAVDREQDRGFVGVKNMEDFSEKKACSVLALGAGSGLDQRETGAERPSTPGGDSAIVFGSNYLFKVEGKGVSMKNGGSVSPPSSEGSSVVLVEDEEEVAHRPDTDQQAFEADLKPVNIQNTTSVVAASRGGGGGGGGGWNLIAHTALPLGRHTVANVRWRVRMGSDLLYTLQSEPESFSLRRLPVLVVDKLSLECREDGRRQRSSQVYYDNNNNDGMLENRELGRVASICSSMKRQLQLLYVENRVLRKTMEDMKAEISSHRRGRNHLAMDELFSSQGKDQNLIGEKLSEESVDGSSEQQQHQFEIKGLGHPQSSSDRDMQADPL